MPNASPNRPKADAVDAEIGARIRMQRKIRGLSQKGLADGLGLTFQQVQKYERGTNRVSAGTLIRVAQILDMHPSELLGCPEAAGRASLDPNDSELQQVIAMFSQLKSPDLRRAVLRVVSGLVRPGPSAAASELRQE